MKTESEVRARLITEQEKKQYYDDKIRKARKEKETGREKLYHKYTIKTRSRIGILLWVLDEVTDDGH